jgi:phenylpyruvate tautomerase PptA (4-oxalocrotonate tautomerase family)
MVGFEYLQKGLYAMARAHHVNTMSGHLGAAVVAGYFIAEQHPDLDGKVYEGIDAELNRIIRGESVFSPRKNAAISTAQMFEAFPKEQAKEKLIDGIADALARNIGRTRESGHNVIFSAIATRALIDHPDLATPAVVGGIRKLIAGFNDAPPGSGYYGKQTGRIVGRRVPLPKDDSFPPYPDLKTMAATVLDELIKHAAQRRDGFGGLRHIINHAAAPTQEAGREHQPLRLQLRQSH